MKENIRTKFTPKDAPKHVKPMDDKGKKTTNRKNIKFKINFFINKSYDDDDDDVLNGRIKRLEQRLRESERPPPYNSNVFTM